MENKKLNKTVYMILPVLSISFVAIVWFAFSANGSSLFPSPIEVYRRFLMTFTKPISNASFFAHVWASLQRVLIALVVAWILGIFFGVLIGWNKYCKAIFGSIFEIFRPIPPIAWIPIIIMWFGIGEFSKVVLVFIGTFFPVLINTAAGIAMVDNIYVNVGKIFGGNNKQILKDIVIPTAIPSIFAGIRTSVSCGWTVVLAAEMMGAAKGLGALVMKGWSIGDMALVLVAVITIAIIGAILAFLLNKAERLIMPWNR